MSTKIKVLIVDDSAVIRTLLNKILSSDPDIQVVGTAPDPFIARDKLVELKPDVMLLDIEMPRMDGITFLTKVMEHFPTRTIIFSSLSLKNSETSLRCFEAGAIEVMAKPSLDVSKGMLETGQEIIAKVKMVAKAKLTPRTLTKLSHLKTVQTSASLSITTHQILAIASSTGGTEALKVVLANMPPDIPGTVIVQHMPAVFTKTYADHLNKMFPFEVKEAQDGDKVLPGRVLIAPGDYHMEIKRIGGYYHIKLHQEAPMHGVRPAADYLMRSVAKHAGANAVGIVLTGMGKDGAKGLLEMKKEGCFNIAQSEETCVVYGMPKAAVELGCIDEILPLEKIAGEALRMLGQKKVA